MHEHVCGLVLQEELGEGLAAFVCQYKIDRLMDDMRWSPGV